MRGWLYKHLINKKVMANRKPKSVKKLTEVLTNAEEANMGGYVGDSLQSVDEKLDTALGELTKKLIKLTENNNILQADRDRLTATLAAANSKYADLYNDYQRGVKINATLEDKCNDLQEESANMSKELVAQREKYENTACREKRPCTL